MEFISNLNGMEILFILILALIIFGPEKLPTIGAKLGEYSRVLRELTSQVMAQWRQEAEIDSATKEATSMAESLRESMEGVKGSVQPVEEAVSTAMNPNIKTVRSALKDSKSKNKTKPTPSDDSKSNREPEVLNKRVQELEQQLRDLKKELTQMEKEAEE